MTGAAAPSMSQGGRLRLMALLLILVAGTVLAAAAYAVGTFERAVAPELAKRTRLIGTVVRAELQRALELGVALDAMAGLDRYLADTLKKFGEVERIEVRGRGGTVVASAQRPAGGALLPVASTFTVAQRDGYVLPILDGNRLVGEIRVDGSPAFVRTRLREVLLDVMAIALVAALVALELTLLLGAASVSRPLDRVLRLLQAQRGGDFRHRIPAGGTAGLARVAERLNDHAQDLAERLAALPAAVRERARRELDAQVAAGRPALLPLADVNDMRPALFLFSVATEVAVAFLPVYARALDRPAWLSPDLAAAAPLVCYLLALALLTPFGGRLAGRFGARRLFLLSVPPVVLSLAALAHASHVGEITLWRGVMAVFYATATIACQEYALRASADRGSTRPLGAFVAVVYSGVFCGAALGGVIAGRFGFQAALLGGAGIAVLSGVMGAAMMRGPAGDAVAPPARAMAPAAAPPGSDARLPALLLGLAVPMSAATAVFVWYLTPLTLTGAGFGPADVARVVMLYYLAVVLLGPVVTALSDGRLGPRALVIAGAATAGAALLSMSLWGGFWAAVAAMAGLGVGHTLMRAPLYALAQRLDPRGRAVGPLRVTERLGAMAGLGACALLLPVVGADAAVRAAGILSWAGLLCYVGVEAAVHARTGSRSTA